MSSQTKPCKACREEIHVAAARCPKCQSYQKFSTNPQFILPLVLAPLFFVQMFLITRPYKDAQLADYRKQVTLNVERVETNTRSEGGSEIVVVGEVVNASRIKWESPVFEIVVQSADKPTADAINEQLYDFVILPKVENKFRLKVASITPKDDIQGVNVDLKDARANRY